MNALQRLQRLETSRKRIQEDPEPHDWRILAEELREQGLDPDTIIVDGSIIVDGDKSQYIGTLWTVRNSKDPQVQSFATVIELTT